MRRLVVPLIGIALVGVAFGTVYRYFLNDPSEASVANYLRSPDAHAALTQRQRHPRCQVTAAPRASVIDDSPLTAIARRRRPHQGR